MDAMSMEPYPKEFIEALTPWLRSILQGPAANCDAAAEVVQAVLGGKSAEGTPFEALGPILERLGRRYQKHNGKKASEDIFGVARTELMDILGAVVEGGLGLEMAQDYLTAPDRVKAPVDPPPAAPAQVAGDISFSTGMDALNELLGAPAAQPADDLMSEMLRLAGVGAAASSEKLTLKAAPPEINLGVVAPPPTSSSQSGAAALQTSAPAAVGIAAPPAASVVTAPPIAAPPPVILPAPSSMEPPKPSGLSGGPEPPKTAPVKPKAPAAPQAQSSEPPKPSSEAPKSASRTTAPEEVETIHDGKAPTSSFETKLAAPSAKTSGTPTTADDILKRMKSLLDALRPEPGNEEKLASFRAAVNEMDMPLRHLGYKTAGSLISAIDQVIGTLLDARVPPPESFFPQLTTCYELFCDLAAGKISRNKTYYDQIGALDETRLAIDEALAEKRLRREEEQKARAAQVAEALKEKEREEKAAAAAAAKPTRQRAQLTELQEIFLVEAGEHIDSMTRNLLLIEQDPSNLEIIYALMRSAHSIKGAARISKFMEIGDLAHAMEDLLTVYRDEELHFTSEAVNLTLLGVDLLQTMIRAAEYGDTFDKGPVGEAAAGFRKLAAHVKENLALYKNSPQEADEKAIAELGRLGARQAKPGAETKQREDTARYVRVDIAQLDSLMNLAADLVINRTRLVTQLEAQLQTLAALDECQRKLRLMGRRLSEALTSASEYGGAAVLSAPAGAGALLGGGSFNPFGPAGAAKGHSILSDFADTEFDRFSQFDIMARDLGDNLTILDDLGKQLGGVAGEMDQNLSRVSIIANDLHQTIMRTRMIPIGQIFNRFPRVVRDLSKELNKSVNLIMTGEDTPLDKTIVEEITDPLIHIVRNAVGHGIETPEERKDQGKSQMGTIQLAARQVGNQVIIEVHDDGRGIDLEKVRDHAVQKGFMTAAQAGMATDQEIYSLLTMSGFSTAEEVTDLSGRGVGLDVVHKAVQNLKGILQINSILGQGTTISLRLPITLAINQALLFEAGTENFAVPLASVDEITVLEPSEVYAVSGHAVMKLRESVLPLVDLVQVLGLQQNRNNGTTQHVIILSDGNNRVGVVVDDLIGREEIVVKNLGAHLKKVNHVAGCTILGDGRVTLILDTTTLIGESEAARAIISQTTASSETHRAPREIPSRLPKPVEAPKPAKEEPKKPGEEKPSTQAAAPAAATATTTAPAVLPAPAPSEAKPAAAAAAPAPAPKPAPPKPAPAPAAPPARPVVTKGAKQQILVVDDSLSIRRYVSGILESAGYGTITAADGVEALEKMASGGQFDLIMTDLEMPRMHGYELITELKGNIQYRNIPIIILTGRMGEKHSRKGLELGAAAFMVKPFNEEELLTNIRQYILAPAAM